MLLKSDMIRSVVALRNVLDGEGFFAASLDEATAPDLPATYSSVSDEALIEEVSLSSPPGSEREREAISSTAAIFCEWTAPSVRSSHHVAENRTVVLVVWWFWGLLGRLLRSIGLRIMAVPGSRSAMGRQAFKRGRGVHAQPKVSKSRFQPPPPPGPAPTAAAEASVAKGTDPEERSGLPRRLFVGNLDLRVTEGDVLKVLELWPLRAKMLASHSWLLSPSLLF